MNTLEKQVVDTYSQAAMEKSVGLCCPVNYNGDLLEELPQEIIDKDYGCGDPSKYAKEGESVLDLGSGVGKMCYMIAKVVGKEGKVTGVDMNNDMLSIARQYQNELNQRENVAPVNFVKAEIQNMKLDINRLEEKISEMTFKNLSDINSINNYIQELSNIPAIPDDSYDLVISNCVLNLVREEDRRALISEIYRVLKPGGRFAISDIVSSKQVPNELKVQDNLWGDCVSGSFQEEDFSRVFANTGFVHVQYEQWTPEVWKEISGIDFRSVTLTGYKPVNIVCDNCDFQIIYKGPFSELIDDADHRFPRGKRVDVCQETFDHLRNLASDSFVFITPEEGVVNVDESCCVTC